VRDEGDSLLRHAIPASKVAPVRHRYSKVIYFSLIRIK